LRSRTGLTARRWTVGVVLVAAGWALAGCSAPHPSAGGKPSVVTSTNVWGDVAAQVGGDLVHVTAIIDDPAVDPHSFEPSAHVQLAMAKADLVVVNGGGYDDFATTMLSTLDPRPPVIDAVQVSGRTGTDVNEHVWYDLPTVQAVADAVAARLGRIDPAHATDYTANAAAFTGQVDALVRRVRTLAATVRGQGAAVTEPVPDYLLDALGLVNRTPPQLSSAIEDETDVPPAVMRQMLDLFTGHTVAVLVNNAQTTGPQTTQVRDAARAAGVPVVDVTETLPAGKTYVSWMSANIDALATALGAQVPTTSAPGASP